MTLHPLSGVQRTGRTTVERDFTVNDHQDFRFPSFADNERIESVIILIFAYYYYYYFCGRSPAEIVGSNPTGGMDICML